MKHQPKPVVIEVDGKIGILTKSGSGYIMLTESLAESFREAQEDQAAGCTPQQIAYTYGELIARGVGVTVAEMQQVNWPQPKYVNRAYAKRHGHEVDDYYRDMADLRAWAAGR